MNVATLLEHAARVNPRAELRDDRENLSMPGADSSAMAVAATLASAGVGPGDRVGLAFRNGLTSVVAYFGVLRTGAIAVMLNHRSAQEELAWQLKDSQARLFLIGEESAPESRAIAKRAAEDAGCELLTLGPQDPRPSEPVLSPVMVDVSPDAPAVMMYTSGTTGSSKAALHCHGGLLHNAASFSSGLELRAQDRMLIVLPTYHSLALTGQLHPALFAGSQIVLSYAAAGSDILQALKKHDVTYFGGVPTVFWNLVHHCSPEDAEDVRKAGRLRAALCAGAPLSSALKQQFEQRFGTEILVGYGLTEVSGVTICRQHDDWQAGSVGRPVAGVAVRIEHSDGSEAAAGDTGEVLVGGTGLMTEYFGRPAETRDVLRNGWFHTGDLGRTDANGRLHLVGRLKDIIIRSGNKVAPAEVEEVLESHPDIDRACVLGLPDDRVGEEVVAAVVLRPGAKRHTDALIEWARTRLNSYAYPRAIHFIEALPIGATGKVLRKVLQAQLEKTSSATVGKSID